VDHKISSGNLKLDQPKTAAEIVEAIEMTFEKVGATRHPGGGGAAAAFLPARLLGTQARGPVPRHPTKPHLEAVSVHPILPDFDVRLLAALRMLGRHGSHASVLPPPPPVLVDRVCLRHV
jgi:hypothetical protein